MASKDEKKLLLGGATFGNSYGVVNSRQMSENEAVEVIKEAFQLGFLGIDSAPSYGESERVMGLAGLRNREVYTKISGPILGKTLNEVISSVRASMKRLGVEQLTGLTFHSSEDFLNNPQVSLSLVEELRNLGIIQTWGVSVYDPTEVEAVYEIETPDYIQAPVNLADRRFVERSLSAEFIKKNIALHARSVYLQGIILQAPLTLPDRFLPWKSLFVSYQKLASSANTSILVLALQAVLFLEEVSRVVVGVNSRDQLIETSLASENRLAIPGFQDIQHSDDLLLIDPRTWTNY